MESGSSGHVLSASSAVPPIAVSYEQHSVRPQSRLPSWSPGVVYRGDDLPGVPLDCFTSSMIDDGSDPAWVPYEHTGCDPAFDVSDPCSESGEGSEEEPDLMEVDED
jgi:hypothetical protein